MLDFCWCSCVIRVGEPWSCKLCVMFLLYWQTVSENSSYLAGACSTSTKSRFTAVTTSTIGVFASRVYRYPRAGHCPSHRLRQVPFCTGQLQGILWRAAPLIHSTHVMWVCTRYECFRHLYGWFSFSHAAVCWQSLSYSFCQYNWSDWKNGTFSWNSHSSKLPSLDHVRALEQKWISEYLVICVTVTSMPTNFYYWLYKEP